MSEHYLDEWKRHDYDLSACPEGIQRQLLAAADFIAYLSRPRREMMIEAAEDIRAQWQLRIAYQNRRLEEHPEDYKKIKEANGRWWIWRLRTYSMTMQEFRYWETVADMQDYPEGDPE